MQVLIKNVDVQWNGVGAKKWGKAAVLHEKNGKDFTQNVVSFKNPEVFKKVQELVGQTVEVETIKEGDFWNWKSINVNAPNATPAATTGSAVSSTGTRVSGSNYETKEERARRQVLIVKQSSLSAAVAILTPGAKAPLDPMVVKDLAQNLADWVLNTDDNSFENMSNDIPF